MSQINSFRDLIVFQKAYKLAMDIFEISKTYPKAEKFSLTDQIRRSSRSVTANIAESYRKRQYLPYFLSKLSDADMENTETHVWLTFSHKCNYLSNEDYQELLDLSEKVGRILGHMMQHPDKFTQKK